MKKKIKIVLLLCATMLCSCNGGKEESSLLNVDKVEETSTPIPIYGIDKTVEAVNAIDTKDGTELNCVGEIEGFADYVYKGDMDTVSENAREIIQGIVQNVTYDSIEGMAWMKVDVLVEEVLKGDLKKDDKISIYMLGGYVSVAEHIKYDDDAFRFSDVKKSKRNDTYIKTVVANEKFPCEGDKNVFYLVETRDSSAVPNGSYQRISGKYGELDVIEEHKILEHCNPDSSDGEVETIKWKEVKKKAED